MARIIDPLGQPEVQSTILLVVLALLDGVLWYYGSAWISHGILILSGLLLSWRLAQGARNKWPNNQEPSLKGRTVVVTGANSGIGEASSESLARWGARVVLACRDLVSAENAAKKIRATTPGARVEVWKLDLSSLQSVREFCKNWYDQDEEDTAIHILLNNAGVMMTPFSRTKDGNEMQFGTNHVGHFLLTLLLVPALRLGAKNLAARPKAEAVHWTDKIGVRVVNVSSLAHGFVPDNQDPSAYWKKLLDLSSIEDNAAASALIKYDPVEAYAFSKIANVYFTVNLNKTFEKTLGPRVITSYSVHPGAVRTNLTRHFSAILVNITKIAFLFLFKTAKAGAEPLLYCCLSESAIPGAYHSNCDSADATKIGSDLKQADSLWDISFSFVKLDRDLALQLFSLPLSDAFALASRLSRNQE